MPCVEVGTVGGGTQLSPQAACIDIIVGNDSQNKNRSSQLASVIGGVVLCGELNLLSALVTQELISAHMKLNRKSTSS
jgi:hydroxymethylglutaryl-CoA reductase (NADPH)